MARSRVRYRLVAGFLAVLAAAAAAARAQSPTAPAAPAQIAIVPFPASGAATPVPFHVGERAVYDVKFGSIAVGSASTDVVGIERLRGTPAWHTTFRVRAGTLFFKVDDLFESWIDTATFSSLRFYQTLREGPTDRRKRYEIYPERGIYVEADKTPPREHPTVAEPLDDGSFLFFVRTVPLEVGRVYESNRYFRPERNPVRVRVLRRETISVPAGRFRCIVVQPVIKTPGIFSEDGRAEVWLSDDARRVVVQVKSRLSFGSINLYLRSYDPGRAGG